KWGILGNVLASQLVCLAPGGCFAGSESRSARLLLRSTAFGCHARPRKGVRDMVSAKTIATAEEYMDRYDVLHQVDEVGRSEAGGDNKIDKNEMNRAEPALALQALPDAEFEKVWGAMTDDAKRLYFLQ